jgi:histidinol-phosphate aminotransferase
VIRIDSNENPYGPGPAAVDAIHRSLPEANRYAFSATRDLAESIGASLGVDPSHIVLGSGSSELLEAAVSAFTSRERGLVTAAPTFELPAERAMRTGSRATGVPVDSGGGLDLEAMAARAAGCGLVYVCNPNNPTGTVRGGPEIEQFIEAVRRRSADAVILLDEAYHDYVEAPAYHTGVPLALRDPRVLVTRTFSKIHGMAGLRIGYVVGAPSALASLEPWVASLTLSGLAAAAAAASLGDVRHLDRQRALNRQARNDCRAAFARAGFRSFESEANFVMVDIRRDCRGFASACRDRGVRVARPFPPLTSCARLTLGTRDEMRRAMDVCLDVLAQPPVAAGGAMRPDDQRAAC